VKSERVTPSELFASTSELFASTSELFASTSELFPSPSELFPSLSELFASPTELFASPSELSASPSEVVASPGERYFPFVLLGNSGHYDSFFSGYSGGACTESCNTRALCASYSSPNPLTINSANPPRPASRKRSKLNPTTRATSGYSIT